MQFTQGATRKRGLCKRAWACVQKDAMGCVLVRRGKSVPGWHVGVRANLCESNHVAQRLCVSACGRAAARGNAASWRKQNGRAYMWTSWKVSAANYSPAPLLVWQRGHSLLMVQIAANEAVCHAHTRALAHTQIGTIITGDESPFVGRKSALESKWKFKGWLNIITILRAWAFSRWWGLIHWMVLS